MPASKDWKIFSLDLLTYSDDEECKIVENIDYKYFSNRASFMGNPV